MAVLGVAGIGMTSVLASPLAGQDQQDRVPVLLVPGWFETAEDLAGFRVRLRSAGWPAEAMAAVTFQDPTGGNGVHAREIARAVTLLRERTGAPSSLL